MAGPTMEERLTQLETKLRRRTVVLLVVAVASPAVLAPMMMRWTSGTHIGATYLVSSDDRVGYGAARVGGVPKTVEATLSGHGEANPIVEVSATETGFATVAVRSGSGPARSGVRLVGTGRAASVAWDGAPLSGGQVVLTIDDKGLVAREMKQDGSPGVERYLLEIVPPTPPALPPSERKPVEEPPAP